MDDVHAAFEALLADLPVIERARPPGWTRSPDSAFRLTLPGRALDVPARIYVDEAEFRRRYPDAQAVADSLLTRHHDGFVRARALARLLAANRAWAPPFIVQLIGEYVIEILDQIDEAFERIDPVALGGFVRGNRAFLSLTRQRVASYWDCYYRRIPRDDYVGFRLTRRLGAFAATSPG